MFENDTEFHFRELVAEKKALEKKLSEIANERTTLAKEVENYRLRESFFLSTSQFESKKKEMIESREKRTAQFIPVLDKLDSNQKKIAQKLFLQKEKLLKMEHLNESALFSLLKDYEELYVALELELGKSERRIRELQNEIATWSIERRRTAARKVPVYEKLDEVIHKKNAVGKIIERISGSSSVLVREANKGNQKTLDELTDALNELKNLLT